MLVIFSSCKKSVSSSSQSSSPAASNSIYALVDDAQVNLSTKATAALGATLGNSLTVRGYTGNSGTPDEVILTIFSKTPITTGAYRRSSEGDNDVSAGIEYLQPGGMEYNSANADLKSVNPLLIVITSISTTKVEGTFSGNLVSTCHAASHEKNVEDGRFSATIAQQ